MALQEKKKFFDGNPLQGIESDNSAQNNDQTITTTQQTVTYDSNQPKFELPKAVDAKEKTVTVSMTMAPSLKQAMIDKAKELGYLNNKGEGSLSEITTKLFKAYLNID